MSFTPPNIRNPDSNPPRARTRYSRHRGQVHHPMHPPNVLPRGKFPYTKVPSSTKQGEDNGSYRVLGIGYSYSYAILFH